MNNKTRSVFYISIIFLSIFAINLQAKILENENLKVTFNDRGIVSIFDKMLNKNLELKADHWSFSIDNNWVESSNLIPEKVMTNLMIFVFILKQKTMI